MRQWNARKDLPGGGVVQFPLCSVRAIPFTPRKVVEGVVDNLLHFNEVIFDPYGFWDGDSKILIPVNGYYECVGRWRDDSSSQITRELWINADNTMLVKTNVLSSLFVFPAAGQSATGNPAGIFYLTKGMQISLHATHWGAVNQVYDGGGTGLAVCFLGA